MREGLLKYEKRFVATSILSVITSEEWTPLLVLLRPDSDIPWMCYLLSKSVTPAPAFLS